MGYYVYIDGNLAASTDINEEAYQILQPQLGFELNKTGSFTFTMLPSNVSYDQVEQMVSQVRVMNDTGELFRGRVVSCEMDIWGQKKIECEDALSYLLDSVFMPDAATAKGSSEGNSGLADISSLTDDAYSGVTETIQTVMTQSLSDTWNSIKSTASKAYTYLQNGGNVSTAVSNWLTDYFSGGSGSGSGSSSGGSSSSEAKKETLTEFFCRILMSHNSQVDPSKRIWPGTVDVDGMDEKKQFNAESISDSRSALENGILKEYDGFLRLRYVGDDAFLDFVRDYDLECTQLVQVGVNIEELTYTEDTDALFSVLLPLGKNNGTIANVNDGSIFIEVPEYIQKYGRIVLIKQWSDLSDANAVKEEAEKYIRKRCTGIPIRMEVKAIDMHILDSNVDAITLGAAVEVYAPSRGIDVKKYVLKYTMDLQSPENNQYTIGDYEIDDDGTTSSYRNKNYTLSNLVGEIDRSGEIKRDSLSFYIRGQLKMQADNILIQANNVAESFNTSESGYEVGGYCRDPVSGRLMKCKTKVEKSEEWDESKWEYADFASGIVQIVSDIEQHYTDIFELYTSSQNNARALLRAQNSLAEEFKADDPTTHYSKGSYVMRDGEMYVCTGETTGGSWTPSKWERTNAGNGFVAVNGTIYAVKAEIEELIADKISATEGDISWLNGKTITTGSVIANYGNFSTLQFNGQTVATQPWVQSYCTWNNIANKPIFNQYSITDTYGNTYTVYGP
ncbi:MAG: hypothetical protein IJT28_08055 [Bacteroidaceae bacterium]|nr:hypothetical protein [Bacteroidaceae bacterium]